MINNTTPKRMERMQKALRENLLKRKKQQRERKEQSLKPQPKEAAPITTPPLPHASLFLVLMGLALALTACGKKGNPEPLEPDTFPRPYPKG
jgi:hypothetical protein